MALNRVSESDSVSRAQFNVVAQVQYLIDTAEEMKDLIYAGDLMGAQESITKIIGHTGDIIEDIGKIADKVQDKRTETEQGETE